MACRRQPSRVLASRYFSADGAEEPSEKEPEPDTSELDMAPHVKKVFDQIVQLSMLEVAELATALQVDKIVHGLTTID